MRLWTPRISTETIGLAVSGGGDSMALLRLMHDWAQAEGRALSVATVNHGLRAEAKEEALMVRRACKRLDIPCVILEWSGWNGQGNLQDEARQARMELINAWARENALAGVATGHTADDQAETFLLRLARGSGVDGLSGMSSLRNRDGVIWFRPLLTYRRDDLRAYLKSKRVKWADDPSNEDEKYDRIKMRKAQVALDDLGLSVDRLVETATRMSTARRALERLTKEQAHSVATPTKFGTVKIDIEAFKILPLELRYRLFSHCLKWVSGAIYRPRFDALLDSAAKLLSGEDHTLSGCHILTDGKIGEVCREVSKIEPSENLSGLYDRRWIISGEDEGVIIQPLGEKGLPQIEGWRELGASRVSLMGTPSIWRNDDLIAAPLLEENDKWHCKLSKEDHDFFTSLVTH